MSDSSDSFARLKIIKEQIQHQHTSSYYLRVYDECLEHAMKLIIKDCNFFDSYVSRLMGWQERQFRRKASLLKRVEFPRLVFDFLIQEDYEGRLASFRRLRLDRGSTTKFLSTFIEFLEEKYVKACNFELQGDTTEQSIYLCKTVKANVETALSCRSSNLMAAYREAKMWLSIASSFRAVIIEKYVRFTLNAARRDHQNIFQSTTKLDDVIQSYLICTARAIDKADYNAGALTSHIQNWFFTGRELVTKQKAIPASSVDIGAIDLESVDISMGCSGSHEDEMISNETVNHFNRLSKIVDPHGAARAFLGIDETLTDQELKLFNINSIRIEHD